MKNIGSLFLIPSLLGETSPEGVINSHLTKSVHHIHHFVVEHEKSARAFLKKLSLQHSMQELQIEVLDKHATHPNTTLLEPIMAGYDVGLISDAGLPCVADPGASIVALAHKNNIEVIPLIGPSSLLLALMASGLNGQRFAFQGYLPIARPERIKHIRTLEQRVRKEHETQIFIETPYRNNKLLEDLSHTLQPNTLICVACDLTLPTEYIRTQTASVWKKQTVDLHKRPTVFLIGL